MTTTPTITVGEPSPTTPQRYYRPLGNRILVKRDEAVTVTAGGIHLPAAAQSKSDRGVVKYVGPGGVDLTTGRRVAVSVRVGDVVVFPRSAIEVDMGGERLVMLNEPEVFAVEFSSAEAAQAFGGDGYEVAERPRRRRSDAGVKRGSRGVARTERRQGVEFEITTTPPEGVPVEKVQA